MKGRRARFFSLLDGQYFMIHSSCKRYNSEWKWIHQLDVWFRLNPNAYLSIAEGFEQVDMPVDQGVVRMVRILQSWWLTLRKKKWTEFKRNVWL